MGVPLSAGTGWGPGENCCLFTLTTPDRGIIRQVQCQGDNVISVIWSDDTRISFIDRAFRDALPALQSLRIERCLAITTTFPDWMTTWTNIVELHLATNKCERLVLIVTPFHILTLLPIFTVTGIMPQDLRGMTNLKFLDLSGNQLNGPIPAVPASLDTCRFENNNVCVYSDALFPTNMAVPCTRNVAVCPSRTSGSATVTSTTRVSPTTTVTTSTFAPQTPIPGPSQKLRFTGCVRLNTTYYPDADTVCRAKQDSIYAGEWAIDIMPTGEPCPNRLSGIWCLVDDIPVPPVTYTTSFASMPTEGPYLPPEATQLALPESTLLSLSSSGATGPAGLLCSTTSCAMSPTSAGQYRVMCQPGDATCSKFLLLDTGNGQDRCLTVLKGWADPAVVSCPTVRQLLGGNRRRSSEGTTGIRIGPRQFANLTELTY
jgi:hypothetical protein